MSFSKRIENLKPSATLAITSLVNKLTAEGKNVVSFTAGQLDFPTPEYIKEEAHNAIKQNFTRYTAVDGMVELKDSIINWTKLRYGLEYARENVLVSTGAKQALYNVLQVLLDQDDEAIMIRPYWVSYPEMIKSTGAKPVIVDADAKSGFVPSAKALENAITDKTKVVILNSPNNPTGSVYSKRRLKAFAKFLAEKDIYVISDEIYSEIIFDGDAEHISIAEFDGMFEKTIIINGVSKTFAMTGWRIGWALGDSEVLKYAKRLQAHSTSNPCSISQKAANAALDGEAEGFIRKVISRLSARRDIALDIISQIPKIKAIEPSGAFYIMIDIRKVLKGKTDQEFVQMLLEKHNVGFIPGSVFGQDGFIRMSIAASEEAIQDGLNRLWTAIEEL
ncbi:MAG: pyridoxal phosphate-dependent aminotransferase [Candidatus Zixiibacteriota bacterium]